MTCKKFRRCAAYRLGKYECDHTSEDYPEFVEKQTMSFVLNGRTTAKPLFEMLKHYLHV